MGWFIWNLERDRIGEKDARCAIMMWSIFFIFLILIIFLFFSSKLFFSISIYLVLFIYQ